MKKGYMIFYVEMNPLMFILPLPSEIPTRVFDSLGGVKAALNGASTSFDSVTLIQYGEAFPYENTTFDQHLAQKGYALWGFGVKKDEEDEPFRITIAVKEVELV